MTGIWHFQGLGGREIDPPRTAIRPAAARPPIPPATPGGAAGYLRPYANDQLNSRVVTALPQGPWALRWRVDLHPRFTPSFVLQGGDRVVVQAGELRLLDLDGGPIATGRVGGGPIVLDPDHGLFYRFLPGSFFAACQLADGRQLYLINPSRGDMATRPFLARRGDRLAFVALERALDPHGHHVPDTSRVEVLDIGGPVQMDALELLRIRSSPGEIQFPMAHLLAALAGDTLVCAAPGRIYRVDLDLNIVVALEGDFAPLAMSLDEAGRIYLVVATPERRELWLLTPEGERIYAAALPKTAADPICPPIVGHDHTAYLLLGPWIHAVGAGGELRWSRAAGGALAGAIVTGDDRLVTVEGNEIAAYNATGERRALAALPGAALCTPPVLTGRGEFLVASPERAYCLSPGPGTGGAR